MLPTVSIQNFAITINFLYLASLVICLIGGTFLTIKEVRLDLHRRKNLKSYVPIVKVYDVIFRLVVSFIPMVNFCYACFEYLPEFFKFITRSIEKMMSQPLIPPLKNADDQ